MQFDGSEVNLLIAFAGGLITFFASCLLPLVPTYLAFLSGVATHELNAAEESKKKIYKREIFVSSLLFTLGFIVVFVLLGASATGLGHVLSINRSLMQKIGGIFFILVGLFMLGVFKPRAFLKDYKIDLHAKLTKWKKVNALLIGATFGFAWTPCIGPVLSVILFWASQSQSFLIGSTLLLVYGLGLGVPFLVIGAFFEYLSPKLSLASKFGFYINKVAAVFILVMGILLILNKVEYFSISLLRLFNIDGLSV